MTPSSTQPTASASSGGTLLQYPFTFWYMRRGKGVMNKPAAAAATAAAPASSKSQQEDADSPAGVSESSNSSSSPNVVSTAAADVVTSTNSTTATTATTATSTPHNPYESSIKQIITVHSVEEFWSAYSFLIRPNDLPTTTDYHFFRQGIKPTWEDPSNAKGGKWIVRLKKGLASRYWEEIILALIGCQLTTQGVPADEVCGAVVSIRYSEDIVSVWNKTANDREITERLRDAIKRVLHLPSFVHMEYKPHEASLQDKSSFRNTMVWKPKSGGGRDHGSGGVGGGHGPSSQGVGVGGEGKVRRAGSWVDRGGDRDRDRSWR